MTDQRSWDDVVAAALVGTARRPPPPPSAEPDSALGRMLAAIEPADREAALLRHAVVLGLYRQAGWRPPLEGEPPLPPSPVETKPLCSEAAAFRLEAMLAGRFRVVLGEWLDLTGRAGWLVPPDRLPRLLDVATADADVRPATFAVIGERGTWLAGLNPGWRWAVAEGPDEAATWATGPTAARRLLLARIRRTQPARARALLSSTWATETADDRPAFLAVLGDNLGPEDEAFLESALDDRRREVRRGAAALLWRLPESRLAGRMAERARALVRVAGSGEKRLGVTLPDHVDTDMARDGIVARAPDGQGERAWWLHQLVAAAPLGTWPEALGLPPSRLVEMARAENEAGPLLLGAWAAAAAAQRNETWALALLEVDGVDEPALVGSVDRDRAARLVADRVAGVGLTSAVLDLLDHCPPPWGPEISATVVAGLAATVARPGRLDGAVRARIPMLAARLDPSVAAVAGSALAEGPGRWSDVVGWFLDLLTFRAEMREEFPR